MAIKMLIQITNYEGIISIFIISVVAAYQIKTRLNISYSIMKKDDFI